jgi:hypothetical protein
MKTKNPTHAFKTFWAKQQLVIALLLVLSTSAFAQLTNPSENNQVTPWSNAHFVYEEQPAAAVYVTPEAAAAMPSALLNESAPAVNDMNTINDVTVWDNSSENHLLVMAVNTVRKNLTAIVYDTNGIRVMLETPIDAGTYRMVEHTRDLKPGTYVLNVLERGIVIEKQKFEVK